jgi:hypothetical protein
MPDSEASAFLFVASCLPNQFALPGKRYGVREDLIAQRSRVSVIRQLDRRIRNRERPASVVE